MSLRPSSRNMKSLLALLLAISIAFALFSTSATAIKQLISLQGKVVDNNGNLLGRGNLTVTIWDHATNAGGSLVFNTTSEFNGNISNGFFDVVLGSISDLNLNLSSTYYMDLMINNEDVDWDGQERRIFQSPVGYKVSGTDNFTVDISVLFVDTLNNRVGIGLPAPNDALEIIGNLRLSGTINASSINTTGGAYFALSGGNVGIGTSAPTSKLHVIGDINITGTVWSQGANITNGGSGGGSGGFTDDGSIVRLTTSGDLVGIGTTTPTEKLSVSGNASITGDLVLSGNLLAATGAQGSGAGQNIGWVDDGAVIRLATGSNLVGIGTVTPLSTLHVNGTGPTAGFRVTNDSGFTALFVNASLGRVGIGTATPSSSLQVIGTITATAFSGDGTGITGLVFVSPWNSTSTNVFLNDTTAKVGIGTSSPGQSLHVIGSANITQNVFYGGNLSGYCADFAEKFQIGEPLDAGDVACLGEDFKARKCTQRAQISVIGVVSHRPTIIGNAGLPESIPIGISGLIETNVMGPVHRYDLLTSSSTPGFAQTASSDDFGAIIGKALEPCEEKECQIMVLVGLQ